MQGKVTSFMLHLFPYVQNYIKKTSHPNETTKYVQEQSMTKIFYNKFSSHHFIIQLGHVLYWLPLDLISMETHISLLNIHIKPGSWRSKI